MASLRSFDLNSDLGEDVGDDAAMLELVSSANVSCGAHAGSDAGILTTLGHARRLGVVVGAHPSYPDRANFGREVMQLEVDALRDEVLAQLRHLASLADEAGALISYVKPHGALYNRIADDPEHARAVVEAVIAFSEQYTAAHPEVRPLPLLCLQDSAVATLAHEREWPTAYEVFADRAIAPNGRLVSRHDEGAVLHDPKVVAGRMRQMATTGALAAISGETVRVRARSICVHGDTPDAVEIARAVRDELERSGVEIKPFAGPTADGGDETERALGSLADRGDS